MEHALSSSLGLGLAAAAGFRVFVPLLAMSVAGYTGHLELGEGFRWLGTFPALVVLTTATILEVGAYYIPWVDHLLDTVSAPAAVIVGSIVVASALMDMDPLLKWSLAIIGGGGLAGIVKGSTMLARGASTATTGGLANPLVSTFELGASFLLAGLSIVLPLLALFLIVFVLYFVLKKLSGWLARRQEA